MRRPVITPPIRSPLVNEARIASAASAHARFGSRLADSGPVTHTEETTHDLEAEIDRVTGEAALD